VDEHFAFTRKGQSRLRAGVLLSVTASCIGPFGRDLRGLVAALRRYFLTLFYPQGRWLVFLDCDTTLQLFSPGLIMPRQIASLTLADAREMIAAGEKKAQSLGVPYNLAVVDAGGGLIAHVRMDGAWLGSVDIAINKAWTARAFDMPTEKLAKMAQSGKPLFGIDSTNHEKVVIFGGGIPLKMGDVVVGALGASGGTVDQDVEVAESAVAVFASKH
jgi:uncharacterized protein GlcG (DUF336 family)